MNRILLALFFAFAMTALGCRAEKTEEGQMPSVNVEVKEGTLPQYEVEQTAEGEMPEVDVDIEPGAMPQYDVDAPTIEVESKQIEVPMPDVDVQMEEKTITVPDIDIKMPSEQKMETEEAPPAEPVAPKE